MNQPTTADNPGELLDLWKKMISEGMTPAERQQFEADADAFVKLCDGYNNRPERDSERLG